MVEVSVLEAVLSGITAVEMIAEGIDGKSIDDVVCRTVFAEIVIADDVGLIL